MEQKINNIIILASKLPQQKLSKGLLWLLLLVIAWQAAQLSWQFIPAPNSSPVAVPKGLKSSSAGQQDISAVLDWQIFGDYNAKPEAPTVAPVTTDAPQTKLNIRLVGLVSDSINSRSGAAIIENQNQQETYGIGDTITGTRALLKEVLPDRVLIEHGSNIETLMLDGLDYTQMSAPAPRGGMMQQLGGLREVPEQGEHSRDAEQMSVHADAELRGDIQEMRDAVRKDPGKLLDYIRVTPEQRDGELVGYRLRPGRDPAMFERMGLQNNDLAVAINGYNLTDNQQAMQAIAELQSASQASIVIERDGEQIDVIFSLEP